MKFLKCQIAFPNTGLGLYLHYTLGSDFKLSKIKMCETALVSRDGSPAREGCVLLAERFIGVKTEPS